MLLTRPLRSLLQVPDGLNIGVTVGIEAERSTRCPSRLCTKLSAYDATFEACGEDSVNVRCADYKSRHKV